MDAGAPFKPRAVARELSKPMRIALIFAAALALAACSKSNDGNVQTDLHETGNDLKAAASSVRNDPDIKQVGEDAKQTAEDAAAQLKKAGAELKDQAQDAADKTKAEAHKAGDQARDSADNLRNNRSSN
jgi:hypothetical protein